MTVNDLYIRKKEKSARCSNITYLTLPSCFPNEPNVNDGVPYAISPLLLSRVNLRHARDKGETPKCHATLSLSPRASPKINSEACFLLWLQMTSACVPPDFCSSQKKPIKKTNSCGPRTSSSGGGGGGGAPPRQAGKHKMQPSPEHLSAEEMEEYTFSLQ